jgi:alkanesulfonate monooxygenase SsuD/methylene tetrahydromethanopterin reductase-like flavin-dependent oxidoreductase (luciferase family)
MGSSGADATVVLGAAAMVTERIKLGTSIFPMWGRHPVAFAQQCVALDNLAPGRFRLGLGPSNRGQTERLFGLPWHQPLGHLREQLTILRTLFRTGDITYAGKYFTTETHLEEPITVPVMASALRPASFRLCGELADGAISWVCPWDYLRDVALTEMRQAAEAAGRASPPRLVVHVPVGLSEDRQAVREAAREQLGRYPRGDNYRAMFQLAGFDDPAGRDLDAVVDAVVVSGTEEMICQRLATILREGAAEIIAHPILLGPDRPTDIERFFGLVTRANREAGEPVS